MGQSDILLFILHLILQNKCYSTIHCKPDISNKGITIILYTESSIFQTECYFTVHLNCSILDWALFYYTRKAWYFEVWAILLNAVTVIFSTGRFFSIHRKLNISECYFNVHCNCNILDWTSFYYTPKAKYFEVGSILRSTGTAIFWIGGYFTIAERLIIRSLSYFIVHGCCNIWDWRLFYNTPKLNISEWVLFYCTP